MHHSHFGIASLSQSIADLQHTTGISSGKNVSVGLPDVFYLAIQDTHREIVLGDIVDSGATTALVGALQFDQLEFRNSLQQISRGLANLLGMEEMTRVVIGDANSEFSGFFKTRQGIQ